MRKILSIASLVMSGFFVYMVCLLAFINLGGAKYVMVAVFYFVSLLFLLIGIWLKPGRVWLSTAGVVLMWGALTTAFLVLTVFCMLMTPELRNMFPSNPFENFNDYGAGITTTILFFVIGCVLQRLPRPSAEQIVPGDAPPTGGRP
jgi:hypothetical protein